MPLPTDVIITRAFEFSKKWKDASDESADAQSFLNDFFEVIGIDRKRVAAFEKRVPMGQDRSGIIDLLWKGMLLVEMKSVGKSLDRAYDQAKDYALHLDREDLPKYIMVSDFRNIRLYRLTTQHVWNFKTSQLHKRVHLFKELAGHKTSKDIKASQEVNVDAAKKMAKLHDALKAYGYEGHALEVYLVRLLFCLFADDTGIFEKNIFYDYVSKSKTDGTDLFSRIALLFEILNMPHADREKKPLLPDELIRFAYIDGTLFQEILPTAYFDAKMRKLLLECCNFDWGHISPAIFGAMFQGVMNPEERRSLGAHYTSEENIMKVIKPLFLDKLWEEFDRIKFNSKQLEYFHNKISELCFLDPACGCGNFLIIAYRELRKLELEVLKMLYDTGGQLRMDIRDYFKVNVEQFYGIEIEEFPCQIAKVGLWLTDHQMNTLFSEHFGLYYARLPLQESATIIYGNALEIDWHNIVPKNRLNYILGNPPFVGKKEQTVQQKSELRNVFNNLRNVSTLDYVAAWYQKTIEFIQRTKIQCALVSTNSITQGEQVTTLWEALINSYGLVINFAYRTFKWSNEAPGKAAVHCVIIGFSACPINGKKHIMESDGSIVVADNINPYLANAPNIFIKKRRLPLCDVPIMKYGSMPIDSGHLILSEKDKDYFISKEPHTKQYIRPYFGGEELIQWNSRYCLWLDGASPGEIQKSKLIMDRVKKTKEFRLSSKRSATQQLAQIPHLFGERRQPQVDYLAIPKVSSENRAYIPVRMLPHYYIANGSLLIIPGSKLYHFGVLTSRIHMIWMKTLGGRMKSDFQYSASIVYNTFPWPTPTNKQKLAIENAAQKVLDARDLYKNASLSELYGLTPPSELVKAHNHLDKAVQEAYGGPGFKTEAERVADLMMRYKKLVSY